MMKNIFFLILLALWVSCSTKKVTEVHITNENDYPIALKVRTNNIEQSFKNIQAHQTFTGIYEWTNIDKKDGQWILFITNEQSGGTDSFSHGYFSNGELNNYADIISHGNELKVRISE